MGNLEELQNELKDLQSSFESYENAFNEKKASYLKNERILSSKIIKAKFGQMANGLQVGTCWKVVQSQYLEGRDDFAKIEEGAYFKVSHLEFSKEDYSDLSSNGDILTVSCEYLDFKSDKEAPESHAFAYYHSNYSFTLCDNDSFAWDIFQAIEEEEWNILKGRVETVVELAESLKGCLKICRVQNTKKDLR